MLIGTAAAPASSNNVVLWLWVAALALRHARISKGNLVCRPCERRDPYRVISVIGKKAVPPWCQKLEPVVMGPCVRRDDSEFVARTRASHAQCRPHLGSCSARPWKGLLV